MYMGLSEPHSSLLLTTVPCQTKLEPVTLNCQCDNGGAVQFVPLYTPFVLRDFGLVAWLFTNRVRDVRHGKEAVYGVAGGGRTASRRAAHR
jgi:hypothetical protein